MPKSYYINMQFCYFNMLNKDQCNLPTVFPSNIYFVVFFFNTKLLLSPLHRQTDAHAYIHVYFFLLFDS